MSLKNSNNGYGSVAKLFHWLMFLLLLGAIIGGNVESAMADGQEKYEMILLHKSFGSLILFLLLARLAWRLLNAQPEQISGPAWQQKAASVVHWLLYLLMFAQPMSGVLMSQSAGYPVAVFGAFTLPTLVEESQSLNGVFHEMHEIVWLLLSAAILIHVAAALKHHFVNKDASLRRITWGE